MTTMTRSQNLTSKVALVSGSSRGIGKIIASHLLACGASVYITGRSQAGLETAYRELREQFPDQVSKFQGDLNDTPTISRLVTTIVKENGHLDTVVANIGSGKSRMGWDVSDQDFEESMQINFMSAVRLSRESLRHMMETKTGIDHIHRFNCRSRDHFCAYSLFMCKSSPVELYEEHRPGCGTEPRTDECSIPWEYLLR